MSDPFAPIGGTTASASPKKTAEWTPLLPVPADAAPRPERSPTLGEPSATYTYCAPDGRVLGYVMRFDGPAGKEYRPLTYCRHSRGIQDWRWQTWKEPRPLYRLDALQSRPGAPVLVLEGEKAVHAAEQLAPGHVCVTSPGGSKAPTKADWTPLRGREVVIWPDADDPGRQYAAAVAKRCREVGAASVSVVTLPDGVAQGWDAADALRDGWDEARVTALLTAAAAPTAAIGARAAPSLPNAAFGQHELNQQLALLPLTDLGNVRRFMARFDHQFRYCAAVGWYAWDGRRWATKGADAAVAKAVHETVRLISIEAKSIEGTPADFIFKEAKAKVTMWSDCVAAWCLTSQFSSRYGCISNTAAAYLETNIDDFDRDPMMINVLNGTLVVTRDGPPDQRIRLKPHDPADMITKVAPVEYDPKAECPQYDAFLKKVQPDEPDRRFLHQWGGLSLTGDVSEAKLLMNWGKGRNGKSTMMEAWAVVAGDYAGAIPIESFVDSGRAKRGGEATPDLAKLPGVRLLRTSEPERGGKLAESLIKQATGGDIMDVRHLNKPFFSFYPQFKLTISGNYRPKIRGGDEGIWSRVVLLPWKVFIPAKDRDKSLSKKLAAEASGILNRLLRGLREWLAEGLQLPKSAVEATAAYRSDSDPLGKFLDVWVIDRIGAKTKAGELYAKHLAWAQENDEGEWTHKGFSHAMSDRGYSKKRSDGIWWLDIELREEPKSEEAKDPPPEKPPPSSQGSSAICENCGRPGPLVEAQFGIDRALLHRECIDAWRDRVEDT